MKKFFSFLLIFFYIMGFFPIVNNITNINFVNADSSDSVFRTYQINSWSDDAIERKDNWAITTWQIQISLGYNEDTGKNQIAGFRFQNVDIPTWATIKSAHLRFFNRANYNSDWDINLTITWEAVANSTAFTSTANDISNRTKTNAEVTWSPKDWWDDNIEDRESPEEWSTKEINKTTDIKSIVEEILSSGWTSWNAMTFFIEDKGNSGNARVVHAYEHHNSYPDVYRMAKLSIEYETSAETCNFTPNIISNETPYLPDYSYAWYKWWEEEIPSYTSSSSGITYVNVTSYWATPNDTTDDTNAIKSAITANQSTSGMVVLHFPAGNYIISDVITIDRGNFVIQWDGSWSNWTSFQIDIPLSDSSVTITSDVQDIMDWTLTTIWGRSYSPYTYTWGFFYTHYNGNRYSKVSLTDVSSGNQGAKTFTVDDASDLNVWDVVNFEWANDSSDNFVDYLVDGDCDDLWYGSCSSNVNFVSQPVTITGISWNTVTIKEPLMHSTQYWGTRLRTSHFLDNIWFTGFSINFPDVEPQSHHFEDGYNGIYMTDVNNSWIKDVSIDNADSGIMVDHSKNSTVEDIITTWRENHYNIMFANSYWILGQNFYLYPDAEHNPSANTAAELCVFKNGYVKAWALDQHAWLNHFNLFDNIKVWYSNNLFLNWGSDSNSPTSGIYNTFWNIELQELSYNALAWSIEEAPGARVIGLHSPGNTLSMDYNPTPYIEWLNKCLAISSLYDYQLEERLGTQPWDTTAPIISQVTAVTTPTTDTTPNYIFNTNEAWTITYTWDCSSSTTNATVWDNTITFNTLSIEIHSNCTIKVTDASWNISNTLNIPSFTIETTWDTTAPIISQVTAVTTPTIDTTPNYTFNTNEAWTITYTWDCSSSTTNATVWDNTITFNELSDGTYSDCEITVTDASGNESEALTVSEFEIDTTWDTTSPTLEEITPVADPTSDSTPSYTFHTDESWTIEYSWDCSSFTTKALKWNNTIIFNKLSNGTHTNCKITVTDAAWNVWLLYISDFEVKVEEEPIFNTDRVFKQLIWTTCWKTFWDIVWHQFEDSIKKVACADIMSWYKEDDSFRPDQNISRLEVTKVLAKSFWFTAEYPSSKQFSDVERDEWYSKYLYPLSQEWAFWWYKDGTFKPFQNISRAEFIKAALKASAIESKEVLNTQFFDVHPDEWYAKYIVRANKLWIINGYKDWNFRPNDPIKRWEVAKIMTRILELQ